jgi:ribosomal-protein-alanine N-acetyltransferase
MMQKVFPFIETERLFLRDAHEDDADDLFAIFSDEETMRYYGMNPMKDKESATKLVNAFIQGFKEGQAIRWVITKKGESRLIGTCGFHNWSKAHHRAEVGYELSKRMRGSGYMAEALNAIFTYGFSEMNLNRIGATISPFNESSIKLASKLGFVNEGTLKDYAYSNGQYYDLTMYSLLNRDFSSN